MTKANRTTGLDARGIIGQIARIREAANLIIEKELQARGMTGIVPAHGAVLHFLFRQQEPVPIKSLVGQIGRVKSTVTGIVNTLERHGYLFKQGCDQDARSVRIGLTDKGRALQQDFEAISAGLQERTFGTMPAGDRHRLMALLAEIERNLAS
jgi:MarR family transcriptional regulator, organic hydroperoxide resistance regulator